MLVILAALLGLDALIAWVGQRRGWTRPVAWLGPALGIFGAALFALALLPAFAAGSVQSERQYEELAARMRAAGLATGPGSAPVITNVPVWIAETQRTPTLALPYEPPEDVLDLARAFPGTHLVVLVDVDGPHWPDDLAAGAPGAECFRELDLGPGPPGEADPLETTHVYEIVCP